MSNWRWTFLLFINVPHETFQKLPLLCLYLYKQPSSADLCKIDQDLSLLVTVTVIEKFTRRLTRTINHYLCVFPDHRQMLKLRSIDDFCTSSFDLVLQITWWPWRTISPLFNNCILGLSIRSVKQAGDCLQLLRWISIPYTYRNQPPIRQEFSFGHTSGSNSQASGKWGRTVYGWTFHSFAHNGCVSDTSRPTSHRSLRRLDSTTLTHGHVGQSHTCRWCPSSSSGLSFNRWSTFCEAEVTYPTANQHTGHIHRPRLQSYVCYRTCSKPLMGATL